MRKIKFRGFREQDEKWIYGSLVELKNGEHFILEKNDIKRDGHHVMLDMDDMSTWFVEKSFGQYTGLHDKNGVEIYEGDIVRFINNINEVYEEKVGLCVYELDECNFCLQYKVRNNTEICIYKSIPFSTRTIYLISNETYKNDVRYEVIGNIYENPELLKSEVPHE